MRGTPQQLIERLTDKFVVVEDEELDVEQLAELRGDIPCVRGGGRRARAIEHDIPRYDVRSVFAARLAENLKQPTT